MALLTDSIKTLPGIGPKKAELFGKLGISVLGDLLRFYPRDYEDRTRLLTISQLEADQPACFIASVVTNPQTHRVPKPGRRMLEYTKVAVADHTGRNFVLREAAERVCAAKYLVEHAIIHEPVKDEPQQEAAE